MIAPIGSAAFVLVAVDMGMLETDMRMNLGWTMASSPAGSPRTSMRRGSASSSGTGRGIWSGSGCGWPWAPVAAIESA